jgi:hypothetical protein
MEYATPFLLYIRVTFNWPLVSHTWYFECKQITFFIVYFYRCTVHFEDSSIATHQQIHQYYLLFKIGFN